MTLLICIALETNAGLLAMIPPTVYYSKVGLELSKLVFQGRKMTPPDIAAFQSYFSPILRALRNPSSLMSGTPSSSALTPEAILSRIRNMNGAQLVSAGVLGAEVLGFFTVGEMIGRLKLVGYKGDVHHHETATTHD
ncbi:ATP synthase subunit G atp20 [Lambiella insularis]|nr:ATP synthase subunit G atp20 [Lambiella insularis]